MMKLILKSPLHGLVSGNMMLLTFTGRKSGKKYTTPVGYIRADDTVICLTHALWWKNLVERANVSMRIQGRDYVGTAEPVPDDTARKVKGLRKFLLAVPNWAKFYDVTMKPDGTPDSETLERAAEAAILIEIQL
jgi:deazaflavin-dependent oxidoreductase (nitroreductase family)